MGVDAPTLTDGRNDMLRSMTGYGRAQQILDGKEILVEIRAVNHRYFEFSSRVPRAYMYLDEKLKSLLQGRVARGKTEVCVTINRIDGSDAKIQVNMGTAQGYLQALRDANETLHLQDDLKLTDLIRFPEIFIVQKAVENEEAVWEEIRQVASAALDRFVAMREAEGARLKADIKSKLDAISGMVAVVEEASPRMTEQYRNRLYAKLEELLGSNGFDQQRILTEAAVFSERVAVDEETVRLRSHIQQFHVLLEDEEPVGRKLDFLIQEMTREVNTIGSKAQELTITQTVVNLKSEIEKIREQIQNIE